MVNKSFTLIIKDSIYPGVEPKAINPVLEYVNGGVQAICRGVWLVRFDNHMGPYRIYIAPSGKPKQRSGHFIALKSLKLDKAP